MQTVKLYWNFTDKKWNLVEIGTVIPEGNYGRSYNIPAEAHFIDPKKSRLVRLAWKLHLFFIKLKSKKPKKIGEVGDKIDMISINKPSSCGPTETGIII